MEEKEREEVEQEDGKELHLKYEAKEEKEREEEMGLNVLLKTSKKKGNESVCGREMEEKEREEVEEEDGKVLNLIYEAMEEKER